MGKGRRIVGVAWAVMAVAAVLPLLPACKTPVATPLTPPKAVTATPSFTPTTTPTYTPSPVWTSTPTAANPTPTATFYLTPYSNPLPTSGIHWRMTLIDASGCDPSNDRCVTVNVRLDLAVNGVMETTAGVTLTTPLGDLTLNFVDSYAMNPPGNGQSCAVYTASFPAGWYVQTGAVYTLTTATSMGVASSSVTAPGGPVSFVSGCNYLFWTGDGNNDGAFWGAAARCSGVTVYYPTHSAGDLASPFDLYGTLGANESGCSYLVNLLLQNRNWTITNATSPTGFHVRMYYPVTCTKP